MKLLKPILGAIFASALFSVSGFAINAPLVDQQPALPEPIKVVAPVDVPHCCKDKVIKVAFILDEKGRPLHVEVLSPNHRMLKRSIVAAVEQWRFTPYVKNGVPVRQNCVMPLIVTEES